MSSLHWLEIGFFPSLGLCVGFFFLDTVRSRKPPKYGRFGDPLCRTNVPTIRAVEVQNSHECTIDAPAPALSPEVIPAPDSADATATSLDILRWQASSRYVAGVSAWRPAGFEPKALDLMSLKV